jgi:putative ABC transport system substrate-binding protein
MTLRRRDFITLLGGTAAAWPLAARAQQPAVPVVGFINGSIPDATSRITPAFRKGLSETGYVEGQNVLVEYHWLDGHYERVPAVVDDLVRRRVAVIATPGFAPAALAAKSATTTIPIVFAVGQDPVRLGLVTSLARPGGNATGFNFFAVEVEAKRLGMLRELMPKAVRIAFLVNPAGESAMLNELVATAGRLGLETIILNAGSSGEIDAAFADIAHQRADALFVIGDSFFNSRRVQLATLAARDRLPASYSQRAYVEVGGLTSYGPDLADSFRQVGIYTGSILKGSKPGDLPVVQSTKLELLINLQTAKALGIEIPPALLATADEVIE